MFNDSKIIAECFFLTLSTVLPISYKVLVSAQLLRNVSSGKNNKLFKNILKGCGPKADPCGTPGIISDHEL